MPLFQLESAGATASVLRPMLLVVIAVVCALFWHRRAIGFWRATLRAVLTSALLFYVVGLSGLIDLGPFTLHLQYFFVAEVLHTDFLGAFWLVVLVSTLTTAFIISLLVGWVVRRWLRRHGGPVPGS